MVRDRMAALAQEAKTATEEPTNDQEHSQETELKISREVFESLQESVRQLKAGNKKLMEMVTAMK